MKFKKTKYKVEAYTIKTNSNLTENDVKRFYKDQDYNVYTNYHHKLIEGEWYIKYEIKNLFQNYTSGYPDFLLIHAEDKTKIKFVEVKLDSDCIRPNQIDFNNKLAKFADVTVAYFNNENRYIDSSIIIENRKFTKDEKAILERCENLIKIRQVKNLKPLWIIATLFKEYGYLVIKKKVLGIIASKIGEEKSKIVWFVKDNLAKKQKY